MRATLALASLASLTIGCTGDVGVTGNDGSTPHDAFVAPHDAGPGRDAFSTTDAFSIVDAWSPPGVDAWAPGIDAFTPPVDAWTPPPVDAWTAPFDGGPASPVIVQGCRIFPTDNPWNQDVRGLPHHPRETQIRALISIGSHLHADWGAWSDGYGIPWSAGTGAPNAHMTFVDYPDESDPRPCSDGTMFCYPIPSSARIEGGPTSMPGDGDRHVLYLDTAGAPNDCTLYEMWNTVGFASGRWTASNGAIFHLGSNALRPEGWTSADAAGLPIMPGLVRYDEVMAGDIRHAIRFTLQHAFNHHIHPATHDGPTSTADTPLYGLRFRLRGDFNMTGMDPHTQTILRAMQRYGLFFADQGSNWYITGDSDDRWNASDLIGTINADFNSVHGSDFEILDTGPQI
jgi:hypothetical protein